MPTRRVRLLGTGLCVLLVMAGSTMSAQTGGRGGKKEAVAGSRAMADRDFAAADSLFSAARGWQGGEPGQLVMNRGLALASDGKPEEAVRAFQQTVSQAEEPGMKADAWNNVGNILLGEQDASGAVEAYMQSLRMDPGDAVTRYNLALAKALLKEQQEQQQDGEQQDGESLGKPGEEPRAVGIQPEDAERILDLLERNEAALRAKLQAQENAKRRKAKRQKIEKDW